MSDDHLSNEVSLSAEITETGVKAASKSRTVAAVDRLFGNVADLGSAWIEGMTSRKRAKSQGETQIIEAAAEYGLQQMKIDNEFAERAFSNHYKKIASQQVNKDAVVMEALEDLRASPPSDSESSSGPEEVSEEFMDRFERYAESATTEELRSRWGRVLASEIRRPGTFNGKVLRTVDELSSDVAVLFERICQHRIGGSILKPISGDLSFSELAKLTSAGLVLDPGALQHLLQFAETSLSDGRDVWLLGFGVRVLGFSKRASVTYNNAVLMDNGGKPSIPAYILTDVGTAIASILSNKPEDLYLSYLQLLARVVPPSDIIQWIQLPDGRIQQIPNF